MGKIGRLSTTNKINAGLNSYTIVLSRKWIQCNRNIYIFNKNNSA